MSETRRVLRPFSVSSSAQAPTARPHLERETEHRDVPQKKRRGAKVPSRTETLLKKLDDLRGITEIRNGIRLRNGSGFESYVAHERALNTRLALDFERPTRLYTMLDEAIRTAAQRIEDQDVRAVVLETLPRWLEGRLAVSEAFEVIVEMQSLGDAVVGPEAAMTAVDDYQAVVSLWGRRIHQAERTLHAAFQTARATQFPAPPVTRKELQLRGAGEEEIEMYLRGVANLVQGYDPSYERAHHMFYHPSGLMNSYRLPPPLTVGDLTPEERIAIKGDLVASMAATRATQLLFRPKRLRAAQRPPGNISSAGKRTREGLDHYHEFREVWSALQAQFESGDEGNVPLGMDLMSDLFRTNDVDIPTPLAYLIEQLPSEDAREGHFTRALQKTLVYVKRKLLEQVDVVAKNFVVAGDLQGGLAIRRRDRSNILRHAIESLTAQAGVEGPSHDRQVIAEHLRGFENVRSEMLAVGALRSYFDRQGPSGNEPPGAAENRAADLAAHYMQTGYGFEDTSDAMEDAVSERRETADVRSTRGRTWTDEIKSQTKSGSMKKRRRIVIMRRDQEGMKDEPESTAVEGASLGAELNDTARRAWWNIAATVLMSITAAAGLATAEVFGAVSIPVATTGASAVGLAVGTLSTIYNEEFKLNATVASFREGHDQMLTLLSDNAARLSPQELENGRTRLQALVQTNDALATLAEGSIQNMRASVLQLNRAILDTEISNTTNDAHLRHELPSGGKQTPLSNPANASVVPDTPVMVERALAIPGVARDSATGGLQVRLEFPEPPSDSVMAASARDYQAALVHVAGDQQLLESEANTMAIGNINTTLRAIVQSMRRMDMNPDDWFRDATTLSDVVERSEGYVREIQAKTATDVEALTELMEETSAGVSDAFRSNIEKMTRGIQSLSESLAGHTGSVGYGLRQTRRAMAARGLALSIEKQRMERVRPGLVHAQRILKDCDMESKSSPEARNDADALLDDTPHLKANLAKSDGAANRLSESYKQWLFSKFTGPGGLLSQARVGVGMLGVPTYMQSDAHRTLLTQNTTRYTLDTPLKGDLLDVYKTSRTFAKNKTPTLGDFLVARLPTTDAPSWLSAEKREAYVGRSVIFLKLQTLLDDPNRSPGDVLNIIYEGSDDARDQLFDSADRRMVEDIGRTATRAKQVSERAATERAAGFWLLVATAVQVAGTVLNVSGVCDMLRRFNEDIVTPLADELALREQEFTALRENLTLGVNVLEDTQWEYSDTVRVYTLRALRHSLLAMDGALSIIGNYGGLPSRTFGRLKNFMQGTPAPGTSQEDERRLRNALYARQASFRIAKMLGFKDDFVDPAQLKKYGTDDPRSHKAHWLRLGIALTASAGAVGLASYALQTYDVSDAIGELFNDLVANVPTITTKILSAVSSGTGFANQMYETLGAYGSLAAVGVTLGLSGFALLRFNSWMFWKTVRSLWMLLPLGINLYLAWGGGSLFVTTVSSAAYMFVPALAGFMARYVFRALFYTAYPMLATKDIQKWPRFERNLYRVMNLSVSLSMLLYFNARVMRAALPLFLVASERALGFSPVVDPTAPGMDPTTANPRYKVASDLTDLRSDDVSVKKQVAENQSRADALVKVLKRTNHALGTVGKQVMETASTMVAGTDVSLPALLRLTYREIDPFVSEVSNITTELERRIEQQHNQDM